MANTARKIGNNNLLPHEENTARLREMIRVWPAVAPFLTVPQDERTYQRAVEMLDMLLDESGGDERHDLAPLIDLMGTLVEAYENDRLPQPEGHPGEILSYLMQEHGLKQADLPEIGSQGIVSEILNGKRNLNLRQIKALSKRFNVSPLVFMAETE